MPVIVYGLDGVESVRFRVDTAPDFRPLEGVAPGMDASFFWSMLPDDLADLPGSDRRLIEAAWKGILMHMAGALTEVAHLDQMSSLLDFPIRVPRKWLRFDFWLTEELSQGSPSFRSTLPGVRGARLLSSPSATIETVVEVAQDSAHSGAYLDLRESQSHLARGKAHLTCALGAHFTTAQDPVTTAPSPPAAHIEGWVLWGYGDLTTPYLAPGAYAAVSTQGRVAAVVVRPDKTSKWAISDQVVPAEDITAGFELKVSYLPADDGETCVIAEVGDISVTAKARTEFRSTQVVLVGADTRMPPDSPNALLFASNVRVPVAVVVRSATWADMSVNSKTRAIPSLTRYIVDRTERYTAGIEYLLAYSDEDDWAEIRLQVWPDEEMTHAWAENTALDSRLIEKVFGALVGSPLVSEGEDSLELKNKVVALLHGLTNPAPGPLTNAIAALSGVPVSLEPGQVLSINTTAPVPEIVIRGLTADRVYRYPALLAPLVSVGDDVGKLQPLCEHPVLLDWLAGDAFVRKLKLGSSSQLLSHEVEKYSAVHIEVPYGSVGVAKEDEGDPRNLPAQVQAYLDLALPLWSGALRAFLVLLLPLRDELLMLDYMDFEGTLSLLDSLTNARDPRYNDGRGFVYDGSLTYDEAEDAIVKGRLEIEVTETLGAATPIIAFGTPTVVPALGTLTIAEY